MGRKESKTDSEKSRGSACLRYFVSRLTSSERGMALLMTILIVTLLSMLILDLHSRSYLSLTRARNSVNSLKAYYIMRSGVSAAMGFLELDAKVSTVDTLAEDWAQGVKGFPVGDGEVSIDISDEASKFNINTLINAQGTVNPRPVERFGKLLKELHIDESLSLRTATWLRDNRRDFSYAFRDISELLLVSDITPDIFVKVKNYLTVYTSRSENNININTVSKEVLSSLSPLLTESLVTAIMDYRKEHPLRSIGDLKKVQGIDDVILSAFSDALVSNGMSFNFSVLAEAKVSDTVRKGFAVLNRTGDKVKVIVWKEE